MPHEYDGSWQLAIASRKMKVLWPKLATGTVHLCAGLLPRDSWRPVSKSLFLKSALAPSY